MKKKFVCLYVCLCQGPRSKVKCQKSKKRGGIGLKFIRCEGLKVRNWKSRVKMKSQCMGDLSNFALWQPSNQIL
jgi:hypothetical protein